MRQVLEMLWQLQSDGLDMDISYNNKEKKIVIQLNEGSTNR